jgi:predicted dehydrogenase
MLDVMCGAQGVSGDVKEKDMLNAAIYGLGRWGERLVESVQGTSEDIRFTWAISRNPKQLEPLANRLGLATTDDFDQVLINDDVQAVVLATPHSLHREQILRAARAGKHVYVEKPLALTRADAEEVTAEMSNRELVLAIGFNRRFAPAYKVLLQRLKEGQIGDVLHMDGHHSGPTGFRLVPGSWRSSRLESPAGGMTPRGIHVLDSMIHIAGRVISVAARSQRRAIDADVDDTTAASLEFETGSLGNLTTVYATAELWRLQVFGTKGWLEMRGDDVLAFRDLAGQTTVSEFVKVDKERAALGAFAQAISTGAPYPVSAFEAINGIAVLEAMLASSQEKHFVRIGLPPKADLDQKPEYTP